MRDGERLPRRQIAEGDVLYSVDGVRVKGRRLPEVIQMLKNTNNPQVEYFVQVMKKWGKDNGLKMQI